LNRQTTFSPILFPAEIKCLALLLRHYPAVKQIVNDGATVSDIRKYLNCRYSEAAQLLAAVSVLKDKFQ